MGLLKNLDLFITVSNSTAHFAGALGIPTILICPKKSSTYYYWNTNSGTSIWYKNIKVLGIESTINQTMDLINNIVEKNNELNFQINSILKKFETGNKLESYTELQKVFRKNKNNNLLRYNLAVMQQKLNFNKEARINYNFLIKNENNLKAMINLYNLDIVEAKYYEALNIIESILKIKQIENVDKDKAFVLCKLNRIEESKKICIFYLKNNNKDLAVLNIIGQCFFHEENYDEAIKIFKNILEIDHKNLSALNSLGRTFQEKREKIKAEEYYLKALKVNAASFFVLNNIAGFYREELEYEKAISFYKQALSVNPNNPYIYNNLSKIYFDLNNHEEAMKNSLQALQMKEDDGDIQKTISFIYLKDHDFKKDATPSKSLYKSRSSTFKSLFFDVRLKLFISFVTLPYCKLKISHLS